MAQTPGQIICDAALSDASVRPVRNSTIEAALAALAALIPTVESDVEGADPGNPVDAQAIIDYVAQEISGIDPGGGGGGTLVDSLADFTDAQTLAAQSKIIKQYVDLRSQVRSTDVVLTSSSTNADWQAAVTKITNQQRGTIWLDGDVSWPTVSLTFPSYTKIRGFGPGFSALIKNSASDPGFIIGNVAHPLSSTTASHASGSNPYLSSDLPRFSQRFQAPGLSAQAGDLVIIYADLPWIDGPWHSFKDYGFPAELVRIRRVLGTDDYWIDGFVVDDLLTPPIGQSVTINPTANTVELTSHGRSDGDKVYFRAKVTDSDNIGMPSSTPIFTKYTEYYVQNAGANDFQIAVQPGWPTLDFSTAGDTVKMYRRSGPNCTIDTANAEIDMQAHDAVNGEKVYFKSQSTLTPHPAPAGIALNTDYFVVNTTANTFQISATQGGAALPFEVPTTLNATTDTFTLAGHVLANGQTVRFSGSSLPSATAGHSFAFNTTYFVVNANTGAGTFQVSATSGGVPILFDTAGSGLKVRYASLSLSVHRSSLRPRVWKVPVQKEAGRDRSNCEIRDFTVKKGGAFVGGGFFATCYNVDGITVENLVFERDSTGVHRAPNQFTFINCVDLRFRRCVDYGNTEVGGGGAPYTIVSVNTNRGWIEANYCQRAHHFFTTGGWGRTVDGESRRYGNCRNLKVSRNILSGGPREDTLESDIILDTHAEGWQVEFSENLVYIHRHPNLATGYAIGVRSRRPVIKNNTIFGGNVGFGIIVYSHAATIERNTIHDCFQGIMCSGLSNNHGILFWGDHVVRLNTIRRGVDFSTAAAINLNGNGNLCEQNTIDGYAGKVIMVNSGSDGHLLNNTFRNIIGVSTSDFVSWTNTQQLVNGTWHEASARWVVEGNGFYNCGVNFSSPTRACIIVPTGSSDFLIADNRFRNCKTAHLIRMDGTGSGHRLESNKGHKGLNTRFLFAGDLASSDIKLIDNIADEYGTSPTAYEYISGTNAATIHAAYSADNYVD